MKLTATLFGDVGAQSAREIEVTWADFVTTLRRRPPGGRKEGELIKLARFGTKRTERNSLRSDENLSTIYGVEGDYDAGEVTPAEAVERLERHNLRAVVVTSWSHRPEKPRWRVFAPFSLPHPALTRDHYLAGLDAALGGILGTESFTRSQSYFIDYPEGGERLVLPTFDDPDEGICIDDWDGLEDLATTVNGARPGSRAEQRAKRHEARDWVDALPGGVPCRYIAQLAVDALAAARREGPGKSAHKDTAAVVFALLRAGEQGHAGVPGVLERVRPSYIATLADRATAPEARAEFDRFTWDAAAKVMASPTPADARGCDCVEAPYVATGAPLVLATLPAEFYEARGGLAHIRAAAYARNRSADGVLYCVLARAAAFRAPLVQVNTGVGAPASLNLIVALVDESGAGKSSPEKIARELVSKPADAAYVDGLPVGTGEGIAEAFMDTKRVKDADGVTRSIRAQVRQHAFFYMDEGAAYANLGARKDSTLPETIRRGFGGETLGQYNASGDRRRVVVNYALGLVIGMQPDAARAVLAEAPYGTPQRVVWSSVLDPRIPSTPPEWPGPLRPTLGMVELQMYSGLIADIRAEDWRHATGKARRPLLDRHEPLVKIKLAGLLRLLAGGETIGREDWQLATTMWETSCTVRNQLQDHLGRNDRRQRKRATADKALEAEAIDTTKAAVARVAAVLRRRVEKLGECGRRELTQAVRSTDRKYLGPAIQHALAVGLLERGGGDGKYRPSET